MAHDQQILPTQFIFGKKKEILLAEFEYIRISTIVIKYAKST
jgi:hypothetical protein